MYARSTIVVFVLCSSFLLTACPAGAPANGPACDLSQDIECPAGQVCLDFECRSVCNVALDCAPAEACLSGSCQPYAQSCSDHPDCAQGFFCSAGACQKRLPNGQPCADETSCASNFCVDGVCCESSCQGTCVSCNGGDTGTDSGLCEDALAGRDPRDDCTDPVACNGAGSCDIKALGEDCTIDTECSTGYCTDGVCCGIRCDGICEVCSAGTGSCDASAAGTDPDLQCGAYECDGNRGCVGGAVDGTICGDGNQCESGFCVDGVCCENACGGTCSACRADLNEQFAAIDGECLPVAEFTDVEGECSGGLGCDGAGVCVQAYDWTTSELLETRGESALWPDVAMNASGQAVAAWQTWDGSKYVIWARVRPSRDSAWGIETRVDPDPDGTAEYVQVGIDGSGNAFAIWQQTDASTTLRVMGSRKPAAGSWEPPQYLSTVAVSAKSHDLAVDASGRMVAIWPQAGELWSKEYNGTSWASSAVRIDTAGNGVSTSASSGRPFIAANESGTFAVAWLEFSTPRRIVAAVRQQAGPWVETEIGNDALVYHPSVSVGADGTVAVAYEASLERVFSARRNVGTGTWVLPASLVRTGSSVNKNGVSVTATGHMVTVWYESGQLLASSSSGDGSWTQEEVIGQTLDGIPTDLQAQFSIAADGIGNVIVGWRGAGSWAARFVPGEGWGAEVSLGPDGSDTQPVIATDNAGTAVAVWANRIGAATVTDVHWAEYRAAP